MILDGKLVRDEIFIDLEKKIKDLKLSLAVIQIGTDEASKVYIGQKEKMCNNLNIEFKGYHFDSNVDEEEIIKLIDKLNNDDTTGILLQLPISEKFNVKKLQNRISYKKDVDGLNDENVLKLVNNEPGIRPCTALGVIKLLERYNINVVGKNVVIVGRSNLVGKPLFNMLLNKDATVTCTHSKTNNLKDYTKNADILISAVGKAHLITADMVKNDCIVVDVGITRDNGKICGDVDFEEVKKIAKYITPVPGGMGPMTIAMLANNIYEAYLLK